MSKSALLGVYADLAPRKVIYHQQDGKTFVETRQECSAIVESAKHIVETERPGADFKFVCHVPDAVLNQAFTEGWFHDKAAWKRWVADPDNRAFSGGRKVSL